MIKVVKLQHFGSTSKMPVIELMSTNNSQLNFNEKLEQENLMKIIKREPSTNVNQKSVLNLNEIKNIENENKKAANINRSKSATEMSILRNNNLSTNTNPDTIKINNLDLNTKNNITDESQKVWKRSILRRQSLKQRKIIEWANKKPVIVKKSLENENLRNNLENVKNNKDDDEEFVFMGDAAAAIIQKSDIERSLRAKLFESELIDLSRARFKKLEMMDYQKRIFIDRQLKKAKSLPGLLR